MAQLNDLLVLGYSNLLGTVNVFSDILPSVTNTHSLGTSDLKWKNVYATTFYGAFSGTLTGNVSGNAGSATKLQTGRTFTISSTANTTSPTFNGTGNITLTVPKDMSGFNRLSFNSTNNTTSPTGQSIVLNGVDNSTDTGLAPGIGFHIGNKSWGSLKFLSDGTFRFYNNACSGYMSVYASTFHGSLSGNATSATKATQDGDGNTISTTYAKLKSMNDMVHSTNEWTVVPSGYSGALWLNYRTCGGTNGNITHYNFGNAKGSTAGVTLVADAFSGTAAHATSAGKISDITESDKASSSATKRRIWFAYSDNTTGRPAYDDRFTIQTSTGTLFAPIFSGAFTGTLTGNVTGTASVARLTEVILNDSSNWKLGLQWRNATLESGTYLAGIGRHNTGGSNATYPGTISIVPYATDTSPWGGSVGLFINKDYIQFENQPLLHSGNYTTYTVTKTGTGASGTWGISITGSANLLKAGTVLTSETVDSALESTASLKIDTCNNTVYNNNDGLILTASWSSSYGAQIWLDDGGGEGGMAIRNRKSDGWNPWRQVITSANIGSQSVAYATSAGTVESVPNGALPLRLRNYQSSGFADANAAVETGFHYITANTNRPAFRQSSNPDYRILTTAYSDIWLQQIATDYRCDDIFFRRKENGTWKSWVQILTTGGMNGRSSSWWNGRDNALLRQITADGYSPAISIKTTSGSWEIGHYNSTNWHEQLLFNYKSDTSYAKGNSENSVVHALKLLNNGYMLLGDKVYIGPNNVSGYGSLRVYGGAVGGYEGLHFGSGTNGMTVMSIDGSHQGLYNQSNTGWIIYNNAANGLMGLGGSGTNTGYKVTTHGSHYIAGGVRATGTSTLNGAVIANRGTSTGTGAYGDAAVEIREYNFGGAQTDTWGYAPRLSFHWSGRVAAQIGLASNGNLYLQNNTAGSGSFSPIMTEALSDGRYVNVSGDTMTGLLTVTTGSSHGGIKMGNTYVTSIENQVIFQNNQGIRFGTDSWDWNCWAGLKYVHGSNNKNGIIYLGVADGTVFNANASQSQGTLALPGIRYFSINGKTVIDAGDSWLRINEGSAHSSGIYFGTSLTRTDGQFQVGSGGSKFYANSSGNGYFSNNLTVGGKLIMTGNIAYTNGGNQYDIIRFVTGDANGAGVVIGGGGTAIFGSGESAYNFQGSSGANIGGATETTYITSDNGIEFYTNCQTIGNRVGTILNASRQFYPNVNATGSLGTSSYKWGSVWTSGTVTADKLKISNTSGVAHIEFSRNSHNYIHIPNDSGTIALCANATLSLANSGLVVSKTAVYPGANNTFTLGTSGNKWSTVYANTFSGTATYSTLWALTGTANTTTGHSDWDGGVGNTNKYTVYDQEWACSSIGSDTGDLRVFIRPGEYTSGGTEVCFAIDGDYYVMGNKVLHAGNYTNWTDSRYVNVSGDTMTGNLYVKHAASGNEKQIGMAFGKAANSSIFYIWGNTTTGTRGIYDSVLGYAIQGDHGAKQFLHHGTLVTKSAQSYGTAAQRDAVASPATGQVFFVLV